MTKPRLKRTERREAEALFHEFTTLHDQLGEVVGARPLSSLGFGKRSRHATPQDIQHALDDPDLAPQVHTLLQKLAEVLRPYQQSREQVLIDLRNNDPCNVARLFFRFGDWFAHEPDIQEALQHLSSRQRTNPHARECVREVHRGMTGIGGGSWQRQTEEGRRQNTRLRQQRFTENTARGVQLIEKIMNEQIDSLPRSTRDWRAARQETINRVLDVALNLKGGPIKRAAKKVQKSTKSRT